VDKRYFIDEDGEYFKTAADVAYSFPMLEIAGQSRYDHVKEVMVVYNDENPRSDNKKGRVGGLREQNLAAGRVRMMDFEKHDKDKIMAFIEKNNQK
jgi:hypothetical protein